MIQSQNNAVTYAVSGNEYIFPYKFFNPSDLTVYLDSRILVKDIDWTIENKEDYSGGARIFLKENVQGKRLTIMRVLAFTQGASFPTYGKLDSKSIENALDKLTMIAQQLHEENSRAIKTSPTDETTADALLQSVYLSASGAVEAAAEANSAAQQAQITAKNVEAAGKAAVDAASEAAESAEEVREALRKSAGVPIGSVFSSPGEVPPEGTYLLNGQTIPNCAETYKKFWAWVQSAGVRTIDNDTFEEELAQYGVCNGFVIDTSSGSVRLPKWRYQAPLGETIPEDHFVWCIQVFNAATALSEQESAQLAVLMQMKAQVDLANVDSNIDFIVEHGEGTGEAGGVLAWWWYDKYRSGKVVQGGKTALQTKAGHYTINLPVEMDSADYVISLAYDGETGASIAGGTYDAVTASNITATSFDTYLRITANVKYKFWRVEGYAATE